VLLLEKLTGDESVSKPFELTSIFCRKTRRSTRRSCAKAGDITLDVSTRSRNGSSTDSSAVRAARPAGGLVRYRADIVPEIWFCRSRPTAASISEDGAADRQSISTTTVLKIHIEPVGSYPAAHYCVTVSRDAPGVHVATARGGRIFYFFEHEKGKHTIVFGRHADGIKAGKVASMP